MELITSKTEINQYLLLPSQTLHKKKIKLIQYKNIRMLGETFEIGETNSVTFSFWRGWGGGGGLERSESNCYRRLAVDGVVGHNNNNNKLF